MLLEIVFSSRQNKLRAVKKLYANLTRVTSSFRTTFDFRPTLAKSASKKAL